MKTNSLKLLAWLKSDKPEPFFFPVSDLHFLLSSLSSSGLKSLIFYLEKESLINVSKLGSNRMIRINSYGVRALEAQFPVFLNHSEWQGTWHQLTCLSSPHNDPQFRYLRQYMTDVQGVALSRGVYLYPSYLADKITPLLETSYKDAVVVTEIKKWVMGDQLSLINERYLLSDISQSYSGISNQIDDLLKQSRSQSKLSNQQKQRIFMVYDRLYSLLKQDIGLLEHYFPQVVSFPILLSRLQNTYVL